MPSPLFIICLAALAYWRKAHRGETGGHQHIGVTCNAKSANGMKNAADNKTAWLALAFCPLWRNQLSAFRTWYYPRG